MSGPQQEQPAKLCRSRQVSAEQDTSHDTHPAVPRPATTSGVRNGPQSSSGRHVGSEFMTLYTPPFHLGRQGGEGGVTPLYEVSDPFGRQQKELLQHRRMEDLSLQPNSNLGLIGAGSADPSPSSSMPSLSVVTLGLTNGKTASSSGAHSHAYVTESGLYARDLADGHRETVMRARMGNPITTAVGSQVVHAPIMRTTSVDQSLRSRTISPIHSPLAGNVALDTIPWEAGEPVAGPSRHSSDGLLVAGSQISLRQEGDDEAYKGHLPDASGSGVAHIDAAGLPPRTGSVSIWSAASAVRRTVSPPSRSASTGASNRSGVQQEGHDGRRTPARYRPQEKADRKGKGKAMSILLDRSGPGMGMRRDVYGYAATPSPAHSIQIGKDPPFSLHAARVAVTKPQARRGAINLTKRQRQRRPVQSQPNPLLVLLHTLVSIVRTACWSALHPIAALLLAACKVRQGLQATDQAFRDPSTGQRVWKPEWLDAYIPIMIWLGISLGSTALVITFHEHVFSLLDQLSSTLRRWGFKGRLALGALIFLTTFPPLPLYSTLVILGGFSFGLWEGFVVGYVSALTGAIVVFLLSRTLLRNWMERLLAKSGGLKKVIRAIEKQPRLLFLIRLAPYPYNLMNTLLASSSTLTLKSYTLCTALALPKLLVHCALGTSIKSFATYQPRGGGGTAKDDDGTASTAEKVKEIFGFVGVALCIGIFLYLFSVARRAVDELDDGDGDYEELDLSEEEDRALGSSGEEGGGEGVQHASWLTDSLEVRQAPQQEPQLYSAGCDSAGYDTSASCSPDASGVRSLLVKIEEMEANAEDYDVAHHLKGDGRSR